MGRLLARELGVPFSDTDRLIEAAAGATIADLFARSGEEAFRAREEGALRAVLAGSARTGGPVVATGGGIVLRPQNVEAMRAAGWVIWLAASPASIRARMAADPGSARSRPALAGRSALDEVEEVLGKREPLYRAASHASFSTDGAAPDEVASRVREWLTSAVRQEGERRG